MLDSGQPIGGSLHQMEGIDWMGDVGLCIIITLVRVVNVFQILFDEILCIFVRLRTDVTFEHFNSDFKNMTVGKFSRVVARGLFGCIHCD